MPNVLDGVEYRTLQVKFPSWKAEENYTIWQDCGNITEFPSGTEFRVKSVISYVVTDSFDKRVLISKDKTEAMAKVSSMLAEDKFATIRKEEAASPGIADYLSDKNVQFKMSKSGKWLNPPHFGGTAIGSAIYFRMRPDTYFSVSLKTGISQAVLTFDDVEQLAAYVDRQLRTSDNDLTITRRPYGNTLG